MDGYRFSHPLRVRWAEVDGQRIVYNANYLMYLDIAFGEYLRRELGLGESFPATVMAKTTLQYKSSLAYDEAFRVCVRTVAMGRTSFTVEFAVVKADGTIALEAETVYVHVNDAGRPDALPETWREAFAAYEPCLSGDTNGAST